MTNIKIETIREQKNMINALHREKKTLIDHLAHYEKQRQTIFIRKMIASTKQDIAIIEQWEMEVQEGIR